jgi:hypothetical protein
VGWLIDRSYHHVPHPHSFDPYNEKSPMMHLYHPEVGNVIAPVNSRNPRGIFVALAEGLTLKKRIMGKPYWTRNGGDEVG